MIDIETIVTQDTYPNEIVSRLMEIGRLTFSIFLRFNSIISLMFSVIKRYRDEVISERLASVIHVRGSIGICVSSTDYCFIQ